MNKKILITGLLTIVCVFLFNIYHTNPKKVVEEGSDHKQEDVLILLKQISNILLIDTTVIPDVVTIHDAKAVVVQQPKLAGVINGDKVLVYPDEKRAIVYSPSRNQIINILPVEIMKQKSVASSSVSKKGSVIKK